MTGLHALHMVIGIAAIGILAYLIHRNKFADGTTVESLGLYWHFVDLVWVFLFPLLYLIDLNHKTTTHDNPYRPPRASLAPAALPQDLRGPDGAAGAHRRSPRRSRSGQLNLIVALGIAVIKAALILLFFMHFRDSDHLTWLVGAATVVWFVILIVLT